MLTTLLLCLGFVLITAYAIWLLSRESRDAGRPVARGPDLIRRMREWSGR